MGFVLRLLGKLFFGSFGRAAVTTTTGAALIDEFATGGQGREAALDAIIPDWMGDPNQLFEKFKEFLGQANVLDPGTPLRNLFESKELTSLIFWGPPGVGKTTLARIIARQSAADFIELSAVNSGLKEIRETA